MSGISVYVFDFKKKLLCVFSLKKLKLKKEKIMKKFKVLLISIAMILAVTTSVYAQPESLVEKTENNRITTVDYSQIKNNQSKINSLVQGTSLASNNIINFYASQAEITGVGDIVIWVAGKIAGYIVDGVIIAATGSGGAQLAANIITAVSSFIATHPVLVATGVLVAVYLLASSSVTVNSYKTTSGNECYLAPSGNGYNCVYRSYQAG